MACSADVKTLTEWNVAGLYFGPDYAFIKIELAKGEKLATVFASDYRGKVTALDGAGLAKAISEYEKLSDLGGRIGSYAQLYYVGNTTDSARSKFYGDVNSKITEFSTQLLFFELDLNRIEDDKLHEALKVPALAHYKPWLDNLRAEKPYQLDDKTEQLFLEKSQTVAGELNRLFDETRAGLKLKVGGKE